MPIKLQDSLPQLRKLLRDPDGAIWDNAALVRYWNRAQIDLAQKAQIHLTAEAFRYPSPYTYAYSFGWERAFLEGDLFQFGRVQRQQAGTTCTFAWESGVELQTVAPHNGYVVSQPWEVSIGGTADVIPVKVHNRIEKPFVVAYDELVLIPAEIPTLSRQDPFWRTRRGKPTSWYWWDSTHTQIGLYPNPTPVITETDEGDVYDNVGGIVLFVSDSYEQSESGTVTDQVALDDNLFVAYVPHPASVESITDDCDWPAYCRHYLECSVLSQAFGADTDGFIPSLRDYWKSRYDMGVEVLRGLKYKRLRDAKIVMGRGYDEGRPGYPRLPIYPQLPYSYEDTTSSTSANAGGYWAGFYWAV